MREIFNCLLTLKNSVQAKRSDFVIKTKNINSYLIILKLLYEEGFILSYFIQKEQNLIFINLNYYKNRPVLSTLVLFNKSSYHVYLKYTDLVTIHRFGVDMLLISTSKGLMPHYKAIKLRLGGRLICYIR